MGSLDSNCRNLEGFEPLDDSCGIIDSIKRNIEKYRLKLKTAVAIGILSLGVGTDGAVRRAGGYESFEEAYNARIVSAFELGGCAFLALGTGVLLASAYQNRSVARGLTKTINREQRDELIRTGYFNERFR